MIDISSWIRLYRSISFDLFKDRIQFIGLQGSYARDEANENSDIDPVLILDEFTFDDLQNYKSAMESMPASPPLCGFLSGVQELRSWLPGESFSSFTTTPFQFTALSMKLFRSLGNLRPKTQFL